MQVRALNHALIVMLSVLILFFTMRATNTMPIHAASDTNLVSSALAPDYYPAFTNHVLVLGTMHYFEFKGGGAHKPFLDNYLDRLDSVRLVQLSSLLAAGQKSASPPARDSTIDPGVTPQR
ncbi:MAG: hypothetical protein WBR15_08665 [Gammaproteobacteria bacterium]